MSLMSAYVTIGKKAKAVEAMAYLCKECGEHISTSFMGHRIRDEWLTEALIYARQVTYATRPCKRHNKKGRARAI